MIAREWKDWINTSFRLPDRAVYTRQGFVFALIFLLRNVRSIFIELLRTRILRRHLVPKRQKMEKLTTDLFKLFCLDWVNSSIFSLFFTIDPLEYFEIVLPEIKYTPETAFSAPFSMPLKTTLSEQGIEFRKQL